MPLPKEDIERIQREAKELYPIDIKDCVIDRVNIPYDVNEDERNAYISGATAEAEKANELVDQKDVEIETMQTAIDRASNIMDEKDKEIERLKGLLKDRVVSFYAFTSISFQNDKWKEYCLENNL